MVVQSDAWLCPGFADMQRISAQKSSAAGTLKKGGSSATALGRAVQGMLSGPSPSCAIGLREKQEHQIPRDGAKEEEESFESRLLALARRFDFIGAPDSPNHWNGGVLPLTPFPCFPAFFCLLRPFGSSVTIGCLFLLSPSDVVLVCWCSCCPLGLSLSRRSAMVIVLNTFKAPLGEHFIFVGLMHSFRLCLLFGLEQKLTTLRTFTSRGP